MSDEIVYGVCYMDGPAEYLPEYYDDEQEAEEAAIRLDEVWYERAVDRALDTPDAEEPQWEDFLGTHYVEYFNREMVEGVRGRLEAGFVVQLY
jgi:hypothetical protein